MYQILSFLEKSQLPLIKSGDKKQVTLKPTSLKKGDVLKTEFGLAKVTDVMRLWGKCKIEDMQVTTQDTWAHNEGFETFEQADEWFSQYVGENWQGDELIVVKFDGCWIQED